MSWKTLSLDDPGDLDMYVCIVCAAAAAGILGLCEEVQ